MEPFAKYAKVKSSSIGMVSGWLGNLHARIAIALVASLALSPAWAQDQRELPSLSSPGHEGSGHLDRSGQSQPVSQEPTSCPDRLPVSASIPNDRVPLPKDIRSALRAVRYLVSDGQTDKAKKIADTVVADYLKDDVLSLQGFPELSILARIYLALADQQAQSKIAVAWRKTYESGNNRQTITAAQQCVLAQLLEAQGQNAALADLVSNATSRIKQEKQSNTSGLIQDLACYQALAELSGSKELKQAVGEQAKSLLAESRLLKEMAPSELFQIGRLLKEDQAGLRKLSLFILHDYLKEPGIPEAMDQEDWPGLAGVPLSVQDVSLSKELASTIEALLKEGRIRLSSLDRASLVLLAGKLCERSDNLRLGSALIAHWLDLDQGSWQQLDQEFQTCLSRAVLGTEDDFNKANKFLLERYAKGFTQAEGRAAAALLTKAGHSRQKAWIEPVLQNIQGEKAPTAPQFNFNVSLLAANKQDSRDMVLKPIAQALIKMDLAAGELPDQTYTELAGLFRGPKATSTLRGYLMCDGQINLGIAKTLVWLRHWDGSERNFFYELAPGGDKGNALAKKCLVRGYIEGLIPQCGGKRLSGLGNVKLALANSETDRMRLTCLTQMAEAARADRQPSTALQIIQSIESQFGPADKATLEGLKSSLEESPKVSTLAQTAKIQAYRSKFDKQRGLVQAQME